MNIIDYSKGKIYRIVSDKTEHVYISSTCNELEKAFSQHIKYNCSSSEILQYDDARIELIEDYSCQNRKDLLKRETLIIMYTPYVVNKKLPYKFKKPDPYDL